MSDSDNNFNLLKKLYKIVQPADLVGRYRVEKYSTGKPEADVMGEILKIFVDTCDPAGSGLLQFKEIREHLTRLGSKEKSLVEESDGKVPYVKLHENVESVLGSLANKDGRTKLHVTSLNTPMLGISLRDTNRIAVFLNAVPSVELSRCVPRLEVGFGLMFPGEQDNSGDKDGKFAAGLSARSPTLLRFLNGDAGAYGSSDRMMAKGALAKVDLSSRTNDKELKESWKASSFVSSGMELFTTPQTLTSPDSTMATRSTPVIDRFSALMSIESLEITSTPVGGTQMNKTAKLNLTLHDRSRLHEVASLIRPDAYSRTTVSLTYGWSHPDRTGNNPIADLINQMVVHDEKFNIVNSTFSFGGSGGVRIVLQLAMKGTSELAVVRIAENEKFQNLNVELQRLSEAIADARMHIPGLTKPEHFKEEVRVYQIIDAAANNAELVDNFTPKDKQQLKKLIADLQAGGKNKGNSAVLEKLKTALDDIEGFYDASKLKGDFFKGKTPRIDDLLGEKFKVMVGQQAEGKYASAKDPFLDKTADYWKNGSIKISPDEIQAQIDGKSKSPTRFVSLGKLLLFYVGVPLQALGTIDEVQFVYYPINTEAGYAGGTNLAAFPIEIQYFRDVMADHAKRKGNANFTVQEFVKLLMDTVISDVRHPAYGMREVFKPRSPDKVYDTPPYVNPTAGPADAANRLAQATGGVFRKPVVELQIECRGGRPLKQGELQSDKADLQLLRIHVYDKLSSAYEPTLKVLQAQQSLQSITRDDTPAFQQLKEIANQIGLNLSEQRFTSHEDLKRFISQVVPVLQFGGNTSGILAATMQTMQNPDLATVNMQRAMGKEYNSEPNGSSVGALPLRVQPSQLDLTLLGCPLLNGAQQYFVDFNTGTTIDDLYTLITLSHTITAGKFESTCKLTPMNAYGSYESVASKVKKMKDVLDSLSEKTKNANKTFG